MSYGAGDFDELQRDGEVAVGGRRTRETFKQRDIEVRSFLKVNYEAGHSPRSGSPESILQCSRPGGRRRRV